MSEPMTDYIKREDAVSKFTAPDEMHIVVLNEDSAISLINSIPSADVAPVRHGKWISEKYCRPTCSVCGEDVMSDGEEYCYTPYCPNCGAEMEII